MDEATKQALNGLIDMVFDWVVELAVGTCVAVIVLLAVIGFVAFRTDRQMRKLSKRLDRLEHLLREDGLATEREAILASVLGRRVSTMPSPAERPEEE